MSDTTTTITPKTILRDVQDCAMGWVPDARLLGNLRAGEICTAIDQVFTALEAAEAENARLRAERDWLAENIADRPCAYDSCPFGLHRPTGPDDDDCDKTHAQCWQEAARRAVAAGEGE